ADRGGDLLGAADRQAPAGGNPRRSRGAALADDRAGGARTDRAVRRAAAQPAGERRLQRAVRAGPEAPPRAAAAADRRRRLERRRTAAAAQRRAAAQPRAV